MTQQHQARLHGLNHLLAGYMAAQQTATLMKVSTHDARCILTAYRKEGAAAIAHGNRCRRPAKATLETISTSIVHLARTQYVGVNHTHLNELLSEHEGIGVTRSTLRHLRVSAGENGPRGRHPSIESVGIGYLVRLC